MGWGFWSTEMGRGRGVRPHEDCIADQPTPSVPRERGKITPFCIAHDA